MFWSYSSLQDNLKPLMDSDISVSIGKFHNNYFFFNLNFHSLLAWKPCAYVGMKWNMVWARIWYNFLAFQFNHTFSLIFQLTHIFKSLIVNIFWWNTNFSTLSMLMWWWLIIGVKYHFLVTLAWPCI